MLLTVRKIIFQTKTPPDHFLTQASIMAALLDLAKNKHDCSEEEDLLTTQEVERAKSGMGRFACTNPRALFTVDTQNAVRYRPISRLWHT